MESSEKNLEHFTSSDVKNLFQGDNIIHVVHQNNNDEMLFFAKAPEQEIEHPLVLFSNRKQFGIKCINNSLWAISKYGEEYFREKIEMGVENITPPKKILYPVEHIHI